MIFVTLSFMNFLLEARQARMPKFNFFSAAKSHICNCQSSKFKTSMSCCDGRVVIEPDQGRGGIRFESLQPPILNFPSMDTNVFWVFFLGLRTRE